MTRQLSSRCQSNPRFNASSNSFPSTCVKHSIHECAPIKRAPIKQSTCVKHCLKEYLLFFSLQAKLYNSAYLRFESKVFF